MPKYRNPAEVYDEGKLLGGMTDLPKPGKKKPTPKKPKTSPCGTMSPTGKIRNYK
jgi:hypothetical protein